MRYGVPLFSTSTNPSLGVGIKELITILRCHPERAIISKISRVRFVDWPSL